MRRRNLIVSFSLLILCFTFLPLCYAKDSSPPSIIFHNAKIYTMEDNKPSVEAILIINDKIAAIGNSKTILSLRKPNTTVIDLKGKVVFPGFIDPHTHFGQPWIMGPGWYDVLDNAQQLAIEYGITTVSILGIGHPVVMDSFLPYAKAGKLRYRLFMYLNYNSGCGVMDPFSPLWYENYAPIIEQAPNFRINGIKIFIEKSLCLGAGTRPVFSEELKANLPAGSVYRNTQLQLSLDEMTQVIRRANYFGYQVAVHAMGDLGIETSLSAIKGALDGGANTNRHMIAHNSFLRDDMFKMYSDSNIVALIEPDSPCEVSNYTNRYSATNVNGYYKRWRELINTGIHVALDSDWNCYGDPVLNPMNKIYAMVTGKGAFTVYGEPCDAPPITEDRFTASECLKMMTTEAAYALRMENKIGSIKPGKLADIVVLSDDPYTVSPPDEIQNIQVLMTMIGGKIEYDIRP